jgi:hypothetical protein
MTTVIGEEEKDGDPGLRPSRKPEGGRLGFLLEALLVATVGGVVGIAAGYGLRVRSRYLGSPLPWTPRVWELAPWSLPSRTLALPSFLRLVTCEGPRRTAPEEAVSSQVTLDPATSSSGKWGACCSGFQRPYAQTNS